MTMTLRITIFAIFIVVEILTLLFLVPRLIGRGKAPAAGMVLMSTVVSIAIVAYLFFFSGMFAE